MERSVFIGHADKGTGKLLPEQLRAEGWTVESCALTELRSLPLDVCRQRLAELTFPPGTDPIVVITSAFGAEVVAGLVSEALPWGKTTMSSVTPVAALGPKTAEAARQQRLNLVFVSHVGAPKAFVSTFAHWASERSLRPYLVLMRSERGTNELPDRLRGSGFTVANVAVYQTRIPGQLDRAPEELTVHLTGFGAPRLPSVLVFTSGEVVRNFDLLVSRAGDPTLLADVKALPCCVLGESTEAVAHSLSFSRVFRASENSLESVIQEVVSHGG